MSSGPSSPLSAPDRVIANARGAGNRVGVNADVPAGWLAAELSGSLGLSLSRQVCDEDACSLTFLGDDVRFVAKLAVGYLQAELFVSLRETAALSQQAGALLTSGAR